ncbi:MAG: iron-sulfur cluster assembly accessory protein [Sulfuricellaceae bacterium]
MCMNVMPNAEAFMSRMIRMGGGKGGFRLVVSPGGCSGLSAEFSIEAAPQQGERIVQLASVRMFVPEASMALLDGCHIDFADSPMESGFRFTYPGGGGCACKSSQTAAGGGRVSPPGVTAISPASIGRRKG